MRERPYMLGKNGVALKTFNPREEVLYIVRLGDQIVRGGLEPLLLLIVGVAHVLRRCDLVIGQRSPAATVRFACVVAWPTQNMSAVTGRPKVSCPDTGYRLSTATGRPETCGPVPGRRCTRTVVSGSSSRIVLASSHKVGVHLVEARRRPAQVGAWEVPAPGTSRRCGASADGRCGVVYAAAIPCSSASKRVVKLAVTPLVVSTFRVISCCLSPIFMFLPTPANRRYASSPCAWTPQRSSWVAPELALGPH